MRSYSTRLFIALLLTNMALLAQAQNPCPPTSPSFTASANNVCGLVPINFTITSPDPGMAYTWNFGDTASGSNNTASGLNASHAFTPNPSGATYTVTAIATPAGGSAATWTNIDPDLTVLPNGDLTKTGGNNWWNAGAISNELVYDDHYMEFSAPTTNSRVAAGLGIGNVTSDHFNTIDFGFRFENNGTIRIYESGANRGTFGNYAYNDAMRIAIEGGVVNYYRNGNLLYTSNNTPSFPMFVDLSIRDNTDTLRNVITGATCTATSTTTVTTTPTPLIEVTGDLDGCIAVDNLGFTNSVITINPAGTYTLDWGDGTGTTTVVSNGSNQFVHTYNAHGIYTITIDAPAIGGCSGTWTHDFLYLERPSADMVALVTDICEGDTVWTVNNTDTTDIDFYVWEWGDGTFDTTFTADSAFHVYYFTDQFACTISQTGFQYDITLHAYNRCFEHTNSSPINVIADPRIAYNAPTIVCESLNDSTGVVFNSVICPPPPNALSDLNYYVWTFGDSASVGDTAGFGYSNATHQFTSAGTFLVNVQVLSQCEVFNDSFTVTVLEEPRANASFTFNATSIPSNTTFGDACAPAIITMNNNSTGDSLEYNWMIQTNVIGGFNFTGGTSATSDNPQIEFTQAGDYIITLTTTSPCTSSTWIDTVTILGDPDVNLDPPTPTCDTFYYTPSVTYGTGGGQITSYQWSFPGGTPSTSTDPFPTNIEYIGAGPYTATVVVTNECGTASDQVTFDIELAPSPVSITNGNANLCLNDNPFDLTATPAGGTWSGAGIINPNSGTFDPSVAGVGTHSIYYTYQPGNCPAVVETTVTVQDLPNVSAGSLQSTCVTGGILTLTGGSPAGGTWSGPGVNSTNGTFDPSVTGIGFIDVTYTYTDPSTCTNSATKQIEVYGLPALNLAGNQIQCNGSGNIQLSFSPTGGTWSGTGIVDPTLGTFNAQTAGGLGTYTLTYTYTDANGCTATDDITVQVVNSTVASVGPDETRCVNDPAFALTTGTPAGGFWTGPGVIATSSTTYSFFPDIAGPGIHDVVYVYGNGSCEERDSMQVTVTDTIAINPIPDLTLCTLSDPVALTATPSGGTWTGPGVTGSTFYPFSSPGNYVLTYTYTDPSTQCSSVATKNITILPPPFVTTTGSLTECNSPNILTLTGATPPGGVWSGPGVVDANAGTFSSIQAGGVGTHIVTYTYTDNAGCPGSANLVVNILAGDAVSAGPDTVLCIDATSMALLNGTPAGGTWSGAGVSGSTFFPSVVGVGTHEIYYTSGSGTCLRSDTAIVTVSGPPVVNAGPDATVCIFSQPTNLIGTPFGGTWTGTGVVNNVFYPLTAGTGVYTLTYTYIDPVTQCARTDDKTMQVTTSPAVNAGPDALFCLVDYDITLTNYGPAGGFWAGPGVTDPVAGTFNPTVAGGLGHNGADTTYYLIYNFSGGNNCNGTDILIVTLTAGDTVTTGLPEEVCHLDDPFELSGFSPPGGLWSGPGIIDANDGVFDPSAVSPGVYEVIYTAGAGSCAFSDTTTVTVAPVPTVEAGPDEVICVGTPAYTLTGNSPLGDGTWSGIGITDPVIGIFDPNVAGIGTHTLTYSYTDLSFAAGCSAFDTKTVTITPLPTIFLPDTTEYCYVSQNIVLTGYTPVGGIWSGPGIVSPSGIFNADTAGGLGSYLVHYDYGGANGCNVTDSMIITVGNTVPVSAGTGGSFCITDGATTLQGASPSGGTWSGPGIINPNTGLFNPPLAGVGFHQVVYTIGTGTCEVSDTVLIEVGDLPVVTSAPVNDYCEFDRPDTLITLSQAGIGYTPLGGYWVGTGITDSTLGIFDPSVAGAGSHVITYTYTVPSTGCTSSASNFVVVNAAPTVDAGDTISFCNANGSVQLTNFTPINGNWTGVGVIDGANGLFNPFIAGLGTHHLVYSVANVNGCIGSDTLVVVVEGDTLDVGPDLNVCIDNGLVTLGPVTPSNGIWSGSGIIDPNGIFDPQLVGVNSTTTLTYTVTNGICTLTDQLNIFVSPPLTVVAGPDDSLCVSQGAYQLTGFAPFPGGIWTGIGIIDSTGIFDPGIAGVGTHTLTYSYEVNATGCAGTDTKQVVVTPPPSVDAGDTLSYCNSTANIQLTGYSPLGGVWSMVGGGPGIIDNINGIFNPQVAGGVGTYQLLYEATFGACTNRDTLIVDVIFGDTVEAGPNDTVCIDDPLLQLTGFSPAGGTWSGTAVIDPINGIFDPLSAGAGIHILSYTYGTGSCQKTDTKIVLVGNLPVLNAGPDETVCINNGAFLLTGFSPQGGTWSGFGITDPINGRFDPTLTGLGSFTVTYSFVNAITGCENIDTKVINVVPLPTVVVLDTVIYCNTNVDITLNGFAPTGGTWSGVGIVNANGIFNANLAGGVGTYNLIYRYENGNNCSDQDTMVVEVIEGDTVEAGPAQFTCIDAGLYNITGFSPFGGTWTGTGIVDQQNGTFNPQVAGAGFHTLVYTYGTGTCEKSDSTTIFVGDPPAVIAGPDLDVCFNATPFTINSASPSGGFWTGLGVDSSGLFTPSMVGVGNYALVYTFVNTLTGCSNQDTLEVDILPPPVVEAGGPVVYCNTTQNITLTGYSPTGGLWSGPGIVDGINGIFNANTAGGIGSYQLVYTYNGIIGGCGGIDTLQVDVIFGDTVDAGLPDTLCIDDGPFVLSGYVPLTQGTWSGTGITDAALGIFDPQVAGTGTHTLTYTHGVGSCRKSDTKTVFVSALPIITAGPDEDICINTAPFIFAGFTPQGGTWSGVGILDASTGLFDPSVAGIGSFTMTYSYTDPITNCDNIDTKIVNVTPLPQVTAGGSVIYCDNPNQITLTNYSPTGGVWTGNGIIDGNNGIFSTVLAGGIGSHELYYTVTDPNGCSATDTLTVDIIFGDTVLAGTNQAVCIDAGLITLTDFQPLGGTWSGNGITDPLGIFNPTVAGVGTHILTYTYGTGTCQKTANKSIIVNNPPLVSAGVDETVCEDALAFQMQGFSPIGGTWSGIGITDTALGIFDPQAVGIGTYTITYTFVNNATGCTAIDDKLIIVAPLPVVDAGDTIEYCNTSDNITLIATPTGGVWSGPGVVDANLGIFNTTQAGGLGTYTLTYTMTDSNSCVAADDLIVNVIFGDTVTAGTAEAICIDAGLITFNDFSPPGGTWSGNGIIDPVVGIFDPQQAGLGNHLLTYTFGAGTCQKESTKTVFVGNLPIVEAGPSLSMCIDEPILQLQQFSPIGGTWQGVGIIDSVLGLFDPVVAGAGTHTIRYTFFNGITGCEDFDTRTIRVNPLPVVSGPDSLEYCNTNVNITLSGYTPLGGTWTGQGIVDPNNGVFNTAVAGGVGNYDIIYSYTDVNGCEASDTTNINVVFGDTVEAGPDLAVCVDDQQVILTGFSPIGGTWSGSGIVDPAGVFDPQAAVVGQFNILTYTFGTGTCQKTDTRIVFVGDIPNVVAGPDQAVCQEETAFNLTAFSPPNGFWTGFGITDSSGVFDPQVAGVGTWILTYTYVDPTTGCENFDTKTIDVQAPPAVDAGAPITYCNSSNNIPLTNFTPAGGIWSGAGIVDALNGIWNPLSAGGLGAGGADTTYPLVYTYTNIVGCFNRDTLEITLIFGDTVYAGAPDTVCIDDPQFSLVGYTPTTGGTWTGNGIIDPVFGIFDPATAGVGLHTISYTFGTGTCEKTDDKTIFVGSLPLIDPGLDEVVCIDAGVFNLSSFSPQGGTWTGTGIIDPLGVFDPQLAGVGTHILTYTFANNVTGCDNFDTKTVQVVPLPVVFAGDSVTYCNTNSDITLSNYTPSGGTWSGPGIVSSNVGLFSSIIAGGIGSYDLVYTFTDVNGCANSDTLTVDIIFGDTVLAGQNLNVCIDDAPFTLTGNTPPSGGTWSGPGIVDAANGIFDPVVAGTGTHVVTWTFGTGTCEKTSSRTIFVGTIPVVDAGPDLTICEDVAPFQLLGNSPIGGVWAGSGITDSIVGIFDPSVTGTGTYTIIYTFTNVLTGCENQDARTIEVVPLPTVVVDDTIEFCINNNNITLDAFVNWSPAGGAWSGPGVVDPATGLFNATIAGGLATGGADTSFTLTYTFTDNNGCSNSDILLVNLTFGDTVEAGPNDTLCLDDNPILLTGFSPPGGTWSGNGVDPLGTFDPLAAGVGTHTLTYTFGSGTCLKSDTRQIVVGAPPTINIGPDQTVCIDAAAFTLTGYSPQGGIWSGVGITDPNAGIFDPAVAGVGSHVLTYTFRNSITDCESSAIRTVTVAPLPTVFAGDSVTYCANPNDITLSGYSPLGGTWSGPGIVSSNLGLFSPIIAGGIGSYDLVYTFTDGNGCTNSDTLSVEIIFGDTVTAGQNMNVCIDDGQITLTGNTPPSGGTWSGPGIIDAANGIFDPVVAGTGTHILTWTFGTGTCEKTSSRTIFVGTIPIVDAGPDLIICEDVAPFQLLGNSPIGGVWTGSGITDSIVGIFDPSVTGIGTYTIVYTFTNILTGCENQDTRTIQVVPLPTVVVDDTINFCINNNNVTLSAYVNWNPAGGSWTGPGVVDPTTGLFNATIAGGLATNGADTSFTLTYTYTDNNGCGNSDILLVNLTFGDTVEAGPNDTLCLDDNPILLTGFSPAGGTWSGNGVDPLGTFDPLAAGVGTHTLTYTFGSGTCLKSDTRQIVVGAPPTINIGPDQTICIDGAAFTLIGYSPQGGTWSGVGITDSVAGVFDPLVAGVGSHILTYTFGNSITGCESSAMRTITVAPLPTVFAGDSVTYCDNPNDITLMGYSPAGGTWSGAGIVDPAQGLFNTVIAGGVGTYPLVYCFTDGNGCNSCDTLIVDVIFGDSVEAGPNLAVCISDGLVTFSGFQPVNGIWSGPGIIDPVGVFDPQVAGAGAHTVYVNTVDTGTCLKIDSRIIFVGTPPIVNPGADETVCISENAYALAGYSPPGGIWTGIGITDTVTGVFDPQIAGIGQHVLLYTVTNSVTNCVSTATKVIDVVPLPFVDAGDTVTYCDNPDNIVLDAPIPTTGGIWSGPGILNPSNGIFNTQNAGGLGVGGADTSYTLTYTFTDQNGCTNADSLLVDIIFGDTVEAGPDDTVCINELPFILQGSPSGGSWSGNGVTGGGLFDPSLAGAGLHTVTYTFGAGSCEKTDVKNIFVALPIPVDAGAPLKLCIDAQPITLSGFTPIGGIWTGAGIIDPSGVFDPAQVGLGLHTITYTYTDSETGCISFDQTTVEVVPLPVVSAGGSVTYCEVNYEVTLPTPSPVGGSWFGPGITNNTLGLFNPTAAGGIGTYQILYTFTDGNGCANSDVLTVDIIFGDTINAGPDRIACVDGDTITLTGFSPVGGTWSGMGIIDPAGLFLPSAAGAGSHNLVYTQGIGTCEKTDTIIIAVVDVTTATAGPDVEFCFEDGLVTLTGQNPTGGTWSGPGVIDGNLGTFLTQAVGVDTQTVSVVVDYTYTDAFSGCAFTDDKIVTINPLPTIDFTTVDTACSGTTVNFTNLSEDAISYVWHFGDGDTSIFLNPTHTYDTAGIYTVTLIGLSDESCPDTTTKDIVIFDIPQADFIMSADTGCGPLLVTFTDNSIGQQMDYFWDFGNGQTSTLANPGQVGFAAGTFDTTYVISLTVTNQCGATTYTDSVQVFPTPNVIFAPNNAQGCTPLTVTFSNATTGNATSYLWDFGDGTTSTDSIPPPHVFYTINDSVTQYTVTLTASNHCGTDVGSVVITVEPGSLNAGFNANVTSGCQPLTVDFTSITQPGDNVSWAFGYNNEVSALLNPVHTFDTAGTFTVYQYVNNNCGFDTASIDITVYPAPPIEFNHQAFVCVGQDIQFFNTSDSISGNLWQFGDGDTSTSINPFHSYDQVGFYEVVLTNYSITNLCPITDTTIVEVKPNPVANFSPDVFQGCAPLTVNFSNTSTGLFSSWDFGDGNVSINSNPTYTYNDDGQYSVTLTTTDNFGCFSDTTISGIVAYPTPIADFETSTSVQCGVDAMVTMINTSQDADAYFWDFGNQQVSNLTNPTISYNNIGDHTITLIANNTFGCADTTQELFTTHPGPIADYGLEPQAGCSPHTVQFIQFAANANSYYWYFGDGDTSRDANPIHTYTEEGFYDVTFIASLDDECFDTLTINSVVDVQGSPTADFEAVEPDPNNPTGVLQMINNSVGAVSYVWDFGDGTTSQLPNPRHEYLENGPVTIELIAFSANGCSDTMRQVITPPFFKGLFVPNAFSPDAGIGDVRVWRPVGVSLGDYKAQIFTPWGELLWESTALDDAGRPSESWDGTNPNGDPMPQGAYVWKIFAVFADGSQWKGQQNTLGQTKKIGSVTLLR